MRIMITEVSRAWGRLAPMRAARARFKKFAFGQQWDDPVELSDGRIVTEREHAAQNGRQPLTNNMIHRLLTTIVGHFRSREDPLKTPADERNRLDELDARMLEEFLISGCAIQRVVRENRPAGSGTWVDNVNPQDFFCSEIHDPRALDVEMVGMFHSWSMAETVSRFAAGSRRRAEEIRRLYARSERCRVIELWRLEASARFRVNDPIEQREYFIDPERESEISNLNRKRTKKGLRKVQARLEYTTRWVGRWLTPEGVVLQTQAADRHPFAFKFYPLMDGEIHPFIEGLIDHQKHVNRLITLIDNMMATSAKGVLLFPELQLAEGFEWERVRQAWSSYDGVIPYNPQPGIPGPQQVVTNPATSGAYDLVNLEMKLFEQAGGVSEALQGRLGGGNSANLFDAQTRNSMAALADIFRSFDDFRAARNAML